MEPALGQSVARLRQRFEFDTGPRFRINIVLVRPFRDLDAEVQRRSREIYTVVEQNPTLLHSLRGANLAVDAATLVLVINSGGIDWSDAVVGPVVAGLRRVMLDAGLEVYLETQKRSLQQHQKEALQTLIVQDLVQPVSRLFARQVQAEDIETARQDFALVQAAAREVAAQH